MENKIGEIKKHAGRYKKPDEKITEIKKIVADHDPVAGDRVKILSLQAEGEVLEVNGDNILVTYGESMVTSVKRKNLVKIDQPVTERTSRSGKFDWSISQRRLNFKAEIDIRGKRGEEALDIVRSFIDDATIVGVSELRILHGKGNGILKNLVREYLNSVDVVRTCKDEHVERGGAGITVVNLDF